MMRLIMKLILLLTVKFNMLMTLARVRFLSTGMLQNRRPFFNLLDLLRVLIWCPIS
jgi:hypothetical protein